MKRGADFRPTANVMLDPTILDHGWKQTDKEKMENAVRCRTVLKFDNP
jgi:hypothetical protein